MKKQIIRLTENDLHHIVSESVKKVLQEYDPYDDIEDFSDDDENGVEHEKLWWSPSVGFKIKPTTDGLWFEVEIASYYTYHSDGQWTDFGWHEDGDSEMTDCDVELFDPYNVVNGEITDYEDEIDENLIQKYIALVKKQYMREK